MNTLTVDAVLDEIVAELAAERSRNAAYVALARAILADDPCELGERDAHAA